MRETKEAKLDGGAEQAAAIERRDLLKVGLGLAAGSLAATSATAAEQAPSIPGVHWDHDVDVVVAGSGNGGMSAALATAKGGAKTLLVEISTQIGGNTLMSGGILHTAGQRTWEDYNKFTQGLHDQVLAKVYVETFWNEYIPWLQSEGAYISRPTPDTPGYWGDYHLGHGEPGQKRHKLYFDSLVKAYEAAGGKRLMQTRVVKLYTDTAGRVIGLQAKTWKDSPRDENPRVVNIRAKKTIMAIGGWIMDGERKQKYLGQDGYFGQNMCGPFSSGEGIDICEAAGAGLSKSGWSSFSGGPYAVTPKPRINQDVDRMLEMWRDMPPEDWSAAYNEGGISTPWLGIFPNLGNPARGVLVNRLGERFIDESSPVHARYPRVAQAIIRQPGGFAWVIADKKIHDASPGADATLKKIIADGGVLGTHGNVVMADTLPQFADALQAAGVYKGGLLKTIEEYNKAVDDGKQDLLPISHFPGNGSGGFAIRTPPFYAVPVRSDSYLCFGGLRMNEHGQTLDRQGTPIPNLYSPPPLGGGIQNEVYTGAIASAGVFGYLAAKHILASIGKS